MPGQWSAFGFFSSSDCLTGTYSSSGSSRYFSCSAGPNSSSGSSRCLSCSAGTYSNDISRYCNPCPSGYSPNIGASSCIENAASSTTVRLSVLQVPLATILPILMKLQLFTYLFLPWWIVWCEIEKWNSYSGWKLIYHWGPSYSSYLQVEWFFKQL